MDSQELKKQALEIIAKCSDLEEEEIQLDMTLDDAKLDVAKCIPLLNELYDVNLRFDKIDKLDRTILVGAFLNSWIYAFNVKKQSASKKNQKSTGLPIVVRIFLFLLILSTLSVIFYGPDSKAYKTVTSIGKTLETIYTIFTPSSWIESGIESGAHMVFGEESFIIVNVILGIYCVASCAAFDSKKYFHQPIIAFIMILYISIDGTLFGTKGFESSSGMWICILMIFYLLMFIGGGLIVLGLFSWIKPKNVLLKFLVQISPLFIWLTFFYLLRL